MGQLKIYAGLAAMSAFGILYFMYNSAVQENEILSNQLETAYERHERDKIKMEEIAQTSKDNQKLYEEAAEDAKQNIELLATLETEVTKYKEQNNVLVKLFSDHDFARLFKAKPNLVIKRMRTGTDRVFQQLEEATSRTPDSVQDQEGNG